MQDRIVVINTGDGACGSLARKLRGEHVYCQVLTMADALKDLQAPEAKGILIPGGSQGEADANIDWSALLAFDLPLLAMGDAALGLCLHAGGTLGEKKDTPTVAQVQYPLADPLFDQMEPGERYLTNLRTMVLPEDAHPAAQAQEGMLGFRLGEKPVYGLAFHVEQNDPDGMGLLMNFCRQVCNCDPWWEPKLVIEQAHREMEALIGDGEAVCALSGGVDSGVCAVMGNMALGHRLHCLFVDTGLMREGESDRVAQYFQETMGLNFTRIDASHRVMTALAGVTSAKEKEQRIIDCLCQVLEEEVQKIGNVKLILQGTNYSDSLLGGTVMADGQTPDGIPILAPLRELFKSEVRDIAEELGFASWMIHRQPFPGTGLALRIFGEVTEEKLTILRQADHVFQEELKQSGQSRRLWKYFAVLAEDPAEQQEQPYVVILRAVQAVEGASAMASRVSYDVLERVCQSIRQFSPKVRRVLYDLTASRDSSEIEWY